MNNYGAPTMTTTRIIKLDRAEATSMALTTYMQAKVWIESIVHNPQM